MPLTAEQTFSTPPQQIHALLSTRRPYIDVFRQLHPHRLVAVEDLPYQESMSQSLFHSQHMGSPISWEAWARQGNVRLQLFRDIILSGAFQTQPALQQEVALLLDSMSASWGADVCGPSPQRLRQPQATAVYSAQRVSSSTSTR